MGELHDLILEYTSGYGLEFLTNDVLILALILIVGSVILATLVVLILKITLSIVSRKTKTDFDDHLMRAIPEPIFRIIVLGGIFLALQDVELAGPLNDIAIKIIVSIIYLILLFFALKIVNIFVQYGVKEITRRTKSSIDDEIVPIAHKTINVVIWALGIMLILGAWEIDIAPILAGLGIAGLALSFAVKDSLANIFGGISLILDKALKVGDKVELDSGEVGVIHDVGLRSTRLRTYDNEIIVIPNSILANAKIKNYVQPDTKLRVVVPFGVEYGTKPEKVIKLIESTTKKKIKDIMKEPAPQVLFTEMADSSLNFKLLFWVDNYGNAFSKKLEATDMVYNELNKAKIGIPFPSTSVYIEKMKK